MDPEAQQPETEKYIADWKRYDPEREYQEALEPNLIPSFERLEDRMFIVASGSSRCSRYLSASMGERQMVRLAESGMKEMMELCRKHLPEAYQPVIESILDYSEPRGSWRLTETGDISDGAISLNKARMAAAAAILIQVAESKTRGRPLSLPKEFSVVGRDFNLANAEFDFLEKPSRAKIGTKESLHSLIPIDNLLFIYRPDIFYDQAFLDQVHIFITVGDYAQALDLLNQVDNPSDEYLETKSSVLRLIAMKADPQHRNDLGRADLEGKQAYRYWGEMVEAHTKKGKHLLAMKNKYGRRIEADQASPQFPIFPFHTANSTSVLSCAIGEDTDDETRLIEKLRNLVTLTDDLPEGFEAQTALSVLTLQPDSSDIVGWEEYRRRSEARPLRFLHHASLRSTVPVTVFNVYEQLMESPQETHPIEYVRGRLYKRPGVIDLVRPPFSEHLRLFTDTNGNSIFSDIAEMRKRIADREGQWQNYAAVAAEQKDIENEMVGVSTASLRKLNLI